MMEESSQFSAMAKETLTYDDLRAALKTGDLSPVYLFHGEEDFLASEATAHLIDIVLTQEERGFNLDIVYGSEADARDIISHASSFPMMANRRVVVVREMDKLPNKELLAGYIEHPSSSTCLVLLSSKPDFRKKPYSAAKKGAIAIEFRPLREYQLPAWIEKRVRGQQREIDHEATTLLAASVGASLREIQNELEKIYLYMGQRASITADDVVAVVGVSKEFNVFELQKAVGEKDVARSTVILLRMLDSGESPTMILVMLVRYFTALWKLHDLRRRQVPAQQQSGEANINPYFLKEYVQALSGFTLAEIEHAFILLASADEKLKSTSIDPVLLLQMLLINLIRPKARALA